MLLLLPLPHRNNRMAAPDRRSDTFLVAPVATAEATLAEADMELSVGHALDDHLEGRLESIAKDQALPLAIRARALVAMCRFR